MSEREPRFVTIVGNVGSGKSTALPIITSALEATPLYADDLFQTTDPFAAPYLKDTPRWAFTNELWLTLQRAKMQREILKRPQQASIIVVDSGLLMSWVYTHSHLLVKNITLDEWELYSALYDELSQSLLGNMAVIRLKYSIETLQERIKQRARSYELEFYTPEYLKQIEMGMNALEKKLVMAGVPIVSIDEKKIADFEHNESDRQNLITAACTLVK